MTEREIWLAAARDLRERAAIVKDVGLNHPTGLAIVNALTDAATSFETRANACKSATRIVEEHAAIYRARGADEIATALDIVVRELKVEKHG